MDISERVEKEGNRESIQIADENFLNLWKEQDFLI